jgi:hypothetical protein
MSWLEYVRWRGLGPYSSPYHSLHHPISRLHFSNRICVFSRMASN